MGGGGVRRVTGKIREEGAKRERYLRNHPDRGGFRVKQREKRWDTHGEKRKGQYETQG